MDTVGRFYRFTPQQNREPFYYIHHSELKPITGTLAPPMLPEVESQSHLADQDKEDENTEGEGSMVAEWVLMPESHPPQQCAGSPRGRMSCGLGSRVTEGATLSTADFSTLSKYPPSLVESVSPTISPG